MWRNFTRASLLMPLTGILYVLAVSLGRFTKSFNQRGRERASTAASHCPAQHPLFANEGPLFLLFEAPLSLGCRRNGVS